VLHLPATELTVALTEIVRVLHPGGIAMLSFRRGGVQALTSRDDSPNTTRSPHCIPCSCGWGFARLTLFALARCAAALWFHGSRSFSAQRRLGTAWSAAPIMTQRFVKPVPFVLAAGVSVALAAAVLAQQTTKGGPQRADSTTTAPSTRSDTNQRLGTPSGIAAVPGTPLTERARGLLGDTIVVQLRKSEGRDWTPVIIALVSIGASVLATWITAWQKNRELSQTLKLKERELEQALGLKQQELDRTLGMRVREQERAELTRRLTTFLGPLKQQLDLAYVLYQRLCQGDPERRTREGFRTLVALLSGETFSDNDRAILDELVATTSRVRELIMGAQGHVDDPAVLHALSVAAAHFRLLELAAAGKIKGEVTRFESSTYPRELDDLVDAEIDRVRARLVESAKI
jgi:hypothetical protein